MKKRNEVTQALPCTPSPESSKTKQVFTCTPPSVSPTTALLGMFGISSDSPITPANPMNHNSTDMYSKVHIR